jgi:hypothetical protein
MKKNMVGMLVAAIILANVVPIIGLYKTRPSADQMKNLHESAVIGGVVTGIAGQVIPRVELNEQMLASALIGGTVSGMTHPDMFLDKLGDLISVEHDGICDYFDRLGKMISVTQEY